MQTNILAQDSIVYVYKPEEFENIPKKEKILYTDQQKKRYKI